MTNILSLFNGFGGAYLAIKKLNIHIDKFYISEIDKYSNSISRKLNSTAIELGDIRTIDCDKLDNISILIAGFPCTNLSIAGNREGLQTDSLENYLYLKKNNFKFVGQSYLFWECIRILQEVKPKYFILENVASMSNEDRNLITKSIGYKPIMINSSLVSAQQRKRYYWTNIPQVSQPLDKKIYLKDIIEHNENDKLKPYYVNSNNEIKFNNGTFRLVNKPNRIGELNNNKSQGNRVYNINGKSVCLSAMGGGLGAKTGLYAIASRGRNIINGKRKDVKGSKTQQIFETSLSNKSNTLTTVQKDSLLLEINDFIIRDKSKCVRSSGRGSYDKHEWDSIDNYHIRKLTPLECERLQTCDDNCTEYGIDENGTEVKISNSQRYKMLGNGFTIDVITHILKFISKKYRDKYGKKTIF
jgi:DNA (cytosine-5)-methyltransferase 3A